MHRTAFAAVWHSLRRDRETRAELEAVTAAGVDLVQGYLFAKPAREFALVA